LAERNGIPIPKRQEYSDPETRQRAAVFQMHEIAEAAFREHLRGASGAEARAYLDKRGVAPAIAEQFGLGYADGSGRFLLRKLQEHNFNAEQLEASGLVVRRDDGTFYDRFRNRLMFPIHNETGKVIAFGGRALDPNDQAKYLNSSETLIYKKSNALYNLHRAKEGIRKSDRTLLVEGYMDVIGVWAAGIREVVATCGTALTAPQIKMMKRHSPRIVVNFDPDAAGANAAERSIALLLDEGMHVRVLQLDAELDPDEYCKERGSDAYRARMEAAKDYFTWLADRRRDKFGSGAEGKIAWLKSMLPDIGKVSDKIERLVIAREVASYIGITEKQVLEEFRKAVSDRRREMAAVPPVEISPNERLLLRLLLANPEAPGALIPGLRDIAAVAQMPTSRIFEALFAQHAAGARIGFTEIHDRLNDDDRALLAATVLVDETDESVQSIDQGIACLRSLQAAEIESRRAGLRARIKEAGRSGNLAEALHLSEELNQMTEELKIRRLNPADK
jgi:DNA primase